jgi:hypothetical protein
MSSVFVFYDILFVLLCALPDNVLNKSHSTQLLCIQLLIPGKVVQYRDLPMLLPLKREREKHPGSSEEVIVE